MIAKEFRALLPAWLACAAAMIFAHETGGRWYQWLAGPAYLIGAAALGALAFGHEYSYRTLPMLLTLPVSRSRIWISKLAVLAPMLAGLTFVAIWTIPFQDADWSVRLAVYLLPAAAGLFTATWLTLVSRSALGGAAFTLSAAGLLMVSGEILGVELYGYTTQVDVFRMSLMWWAMSALIVAGAVRGRRAFLLLESTDGHSGHIGLPFVGGAAATRVPGRRRGVTGLLIRKELRLQQGAFVLAAVYIVVFLALASLSRSARDLQVITMVTRTIYSGLVALLAGSLASAEERELGTHDMQQLLAVASARQWVVKAGTALIVSVLLAAVLPSLLTALAGPAPETPPGSRWMFHQGPLIVVLVLTTIGLYVSTICRSGLTAIVLSLPVTIALQFLSLRYGPSLGVSTFRALVPHRRIWRGDVLTLEQPMWLVVAAVFILVVLRLALTNERSASQSAARIALHAAAAVLVVAAGFAAVGAAAAFY